MNRFILFILLITAAVVGVYYWKNSKSTNITKISDVQKPGENKTNMPLAVPYGYSISIFAKDLGGPRDLILDPNRDILVSLTGQGKVVAFPGGNTTVVAEGLNRPHGLAFEGNRLFIAETDKVAVYDYDASAHKATNKRKIIDIPGGGRHFTRSLLIKDRKLYISIGSSCDTCQEADARRASIWFSNLDGSDFKVYARGLRNSVFMATNTSTNEIWATEMGRDFLGDDMPPDEVNIIKESVFYGWPYCWGDGNPDSQMNSGGKKFNCADSQNPKIKLQAHSAPLGLAFLGSDLLVAYHGSWNRSLPTGYKIVKFKLDTQGNTIGSEDFVSGWLTSDGQVLGRPVDILIKENDIFISDDKSGVIYLLKKI